MMILYHLVLLRTLSLLVVMMMFCKDNLNCKYRTVGRPKLCIEYEVTDSCRRPGGQHVAEGLRLREICTT